MTDVPFDDAARRRTLAPVLGLDDFRPLSSVVRAEVAARTHSGRGRTYNEDHYLVLRLGRSQEVLASSLPDSDVLARFDESAYTMIVADGLGGTGPGGVASRVALGTLAHLALHYGRLESARGWSNGRGDRRAC